MTYWETIHTENREGFEIRFSVAPEDTHPRDCFDETPEDMAEMLEKIDRGFYCWFIAKVSVYRLGLELGADYLGGNLYEKEKDFLVEGGYFDDMVHVALQQAKEKIKELTEEVQNEY
jgi:hypothetical protein